jgi:hypothetical protein
MKREKELTSNAPDNNPNARANNNNRGGGGDDEEEVENPLSDLVSELIDKRDTILYTIKDWIY